MGKKSKLKRCQAPFWPKRGLAPFAFLLLTSCATTQSLTPPLIYEIIPASKSLQTSTRFHVVDDFNSGELKNKRGFQWEILEPSGGLLNLIRDKEDARSSGRGHSFKISYNLAPGQKASVKSSLGRLDMSQAEWLALKCRIQTGSDSQIASRLAISLTDWSGKSTGQDITDLCATSPSAPTLTLPLEDEGGGNGRGQRVRVRGWKDVILPLEQFKSLDFDQLSSVEISLKAESEPIKGSVWIDEIVFYGKEELDFESHRDNLQGFPNENADTRRYAELWAATEDSQFLKEIARDTWKYFENAHDKHTHLVIDHLRVGESPLAADYTSVTNIAMDLMATVAAYDLEFISRAEAAGRIKNIFSTLKTLKRWQGFFYNFYDTNKLAVTREYISTVDSGWLAIAFVIIRQAFAHELGGEATAFLDQFNFSELLDPTNNQLAIGFDTAKGELSSNHYGLLATEARATSFYAIGKGDLDRKHWWFIYRTPPEAWKWQNQMPQGRRAEQDGVDYFQGYYVYQGKKFVPSWGGSLFEFLMPTLVMKEKELAPKGLGLNNRIATEIHRDYALKEKGYPVWGISPAATNSGRQWRYREFGIKALSAKGYRDHQVITPHVSFLALETLPEEALANIHRLLNYENFSIYGDYGFYDSLDFRTGSVNPQYLALNQGMILVAICNYLKKGSIRERFHADPVGKRAEDLLMKESFFET